jgi:hypothetical protein
MAKKDENNKYLIVWFVVSILYIAVMEGSLGVSAIRDHPGALLGILFSGVYLVGNYLE